MSNGVTDLLPDMAAADVIWVVQLLEHSQIDVWVDGGWGIDALLGEQTRPHEDLDIVVQQMELPKLRRLFSGQGYKDVERPDSQAWNFVLGDQNGHQVDVHAVVFDEKRNGIFGPVENGLMYPAGSLLGNGVIGGYPVRCIAAEYVILFHRNYEPRPKDFLDVTALCQRFGLAYPEEYARIRKP